MAPVQRILCDLCGQAFKTAYTLNRHKQNTHFGSKVQCADCGKFYRRRDNLERHVEVVHLNIRREYPCEFCGKIFKRSGNRSEHRRLHCKSRRPKPKDGPSVQPTSSFSSFSSSSSSSSSYSFSCSEDDNMDSDSSVKSVKTTQPTKPVQGRLCELCGKAFKNAYTLNRHKQNTHFGSKVQCADCGKFYRRREYLERHVEVVHQNIRREYPCELCGKIFNQTGNRSAHRRFHCIMLQSEPQGGPSVQPTSSSEEDNMDSDSSGKTVQPT